MGFKSQEEQLRETGFYFYSAASLTAEDAWLKLSLHFSLFHQSLQEMVLVC